MYTGLDGELEQLRTQNEVKLQNNTPKVHGLVVGRGRNQKDLSSCESEERDMGGGKCLLAQQNKKDCCLL